jgi:hypothetical protein
MVILGQLTFHMEAPVGYGGDALPTWIMSLNRQLLIEQPKERLNGVQFVPAQ